MRCPNCDEGIFFSKKRKMYKCFNCNWENSLKNMIWKCKVCGKDFYSGVTSYIKFENKPNKISYIKTLIDKIPAKPYYVPCCNYDPRNVDFIHSFDCEGILYLGNYYHQIDKNYKETDFKNMKVGIPKSEIQWQLFFDKVNIQNESLFESNKVQLSYEFGLILSVQK